VLPQAEVNVRHAQRCTGVVSAAKICQITYRSKKIRSVDRSYKRILNTCWLLSIADSGASMARVMALDTALRGGYEHSRYSAVGLIASQPKETYTWHSAYRYN
jgi:hypothetical protein